MTEETDRALSKEEFDKIVDDLTDSFCLLRWRWAGAPGTLRTDRTIRKQVIISCPDRPTDSDQFLTFRLDMLDSGVMLLANRMAVEYGDGEAALAFWRDSMHTYNWLGKVSNCVVYNVHCARCVQCVQSGYSMYTIELFSSTTVFKPRGRLPHVPASSGPG